MRNQSIPGRLSPPTRPGYEATPLRDRICSAFYPYYDRTTPVVFPHRFRSISAVLRSFRCISAVFPLCFPVSPHCCRSPSAVFGCVNLSEKTVAETLSNQRLMYSAMVLLFNTLSVCSLLLMSPLPLFLEGL